jgi:DNA helicase-2/ATP-dependent DNA helicase PcrA
MKNSKSLTEEQVRVIAAPVTVPVVVLAGAGSGKTTMLVHRIKRMITELGISPSEIVAVTFTNEMANQLSDRIYQVCKSVLLQFNTCTIHAYCYRLLKKYYDKDLVLVKPWLIKNLLDEEMSKRNLLQVGLRTMEWWIDRPNREGIEDNYIEEWYKWILSSLSIPSWVADHTYQIYLKVEDLLSANHSTTYGKMLGDVWKNLNLDAFLNAVRKTHKYVLIDEGQDTTELSARILFKIFSPRIFIVGDPDQTLFRWSGSTPEVNLFGLAEQPQSITLKVGVNFRSTRTIVRSADQLIDKNYTQEIAKYRKDLFVPEEALEGSPIVISHYGSALQEAESVSTEIANKIHEGQDPNDFFIGYRINAQSALLESHFFSKQIPFRTLGTAGSFFSHKHIKDLTSYLKLSLDRDDDESFSRVYNIPSIRMRGYGGDYVHHRWLGKKFLAECEVLGKGSLWKGALKISNPKFKRGTQDLIHFIDRLNKFTIASESIDYLLSDCYRKYHVSIHGVSEAGFESDVEEDWKTLLTLARKRTVKEFVDEVDKIEKESTQQKRHEVLLGTVHKLKGLERKIVYGIGWSEGLLPHHRSLIPYQPRPEEILFIPSQGNLEDERRIAFVLITRAQEELHLSSVGEWNGNAMRPSRFLEEVKAEHEGDKRSSIIDSNRGDGIQGKSDSVSTKRRKTTLRKVSKNKRQKPSAQKRKKGK